MKTLFRIGITVSLAIITYLDNHKQILGNDSKDTAIEAYKAWKAKAPEVMETVKRVSLPPSWLKEAHGGRMPVEEHDTSHLYHTGISQGKTASLPLGDQ